MRRFSRRRTRHDNAAKCVKNSERLFSLLFFPHIFEPLSSLVGIGLRPRIYNHFRGNDPGETAFARFPQNDSFFSLVLYGAIISYCFPPIRKQRAVRVCRRRRDSDSGPFGTIGFFFLFFPSHTQFLIQWSPGRGTKIQKRLGDTHTIADMGLSDGLNMWTVQETRSPSNVYRTLVAVLQCCIDSNNNHIKYYI